MKTVLVTNAFKESNMKYSFKKILVFLLCTGSALSMDTETHTEFRQEPPQSRIEVPFEERRLTEDLIPALSRSADCGMLLHMALYCPSRYPEDIVKPVISGISTEKALILWKSAQSLQDPTVKEHVLCQLRKFWPEGLVAVSQIVNAGFSVDEALNGLFRQIKLDIPRTSDTLLSFGGNTTLITLKLRGNYIGDAGAKILGKVLAENTTLTTLNLEYNLISPVGMKSLATGLEKNSTLTTLTSGYNCLEDEGTGYLADVLKINRTLTSLNLECNTITDQGAGYLTEALAKNTTLTHLNLSDNFIFAQGAKLLTAASKLNTPCPTLNLQDNFIDIELNMDIKEFIKGVGSKTYKQEFDNRGSGIFYPKFCENEKELAQCSITELLAQRLKMVFDLRKLHDHPIESPKQYLEYKKNIDRNHTRLMINMMKVLNVKEFNAIFGATSNSRILDADHAINIALALKARIPEETEKLAQLDAEIKNFQSWKQTEGHPLILGKTSFLQSQDELSSSESEGSESEQEIRRVPVLSVSELPIRTTGSQCCPLF
jgi:hypothetical protein